MVRKCPNPRSGDLGITIEGFTWIFLFLNLNLNTIFFTPPLHILKFLFVTTLNAREDDGFHSVI